MADDIRDLHREVMEMMDETINELTALCPPTIADAFGGITGWSLIAVVHGKEIEIPRKSQDEYGAEYNYEDDDALTTFDRWGDLKAGQSFIDRKPKRAA